MPANATRNASAAGAVSPYLKFLERPFSASIHSLRHRRRDWMRGEAMIGKVARMLAGRSVAGKLGYSAGAGAVAGLLAPVAIRLVGSLVGKAGRAAADARRGRVEPKYGRNLTGIDRDGG